MEEGLDIRAVVTEKRPTMRPAREKTRPSNWHWSPHKLTAELLVAAAP